MSEQNQENEQQNTVVDKDGKEIKPKRLGFFKKVWYSIAKFEKYIEMSLEGTGRALKYLLQITSLFVLVISCIGIYNANENLDGFIKNIEDNIPDFSYADGQIALSSEVESKVYTMSDTNLNFGKIIIDLNTEDENVIAEYENEIKNDDEVNNIGIIILKDKVLQVAKLTDGEEGESRISMSYDELMESIFGSTNVEITKSNLLEYLNGNGRTSILVVNFCSYFIAYFIIYLCSGLIYILILALIGYTSVKITKIKLTFAQLFAMSTYAFTLSNILNMVYFIANYFGGITIKYFDIAYIAIAYIYLAAAIFILKDDIIKRMQEVEKIQQEQQKVKEEIKEEKPKNKKEKDKKDEKDEKENEGDEPQGSEV